MNPFHCPYCQSEFIHHEHIEIFNRRREDADEGMHISIYNQSLAVVVVFADTSMERNPSRRRDGIRITFWCENCPAHPVMTIIQHKGQTLISIE
jgi:hypothetical protein